MDLKSYLEEKGRGSGEATRLAEAMGVSLSYLCQMASGDASVSPVRCVELEKFTNGAVDRPSMRPNDWKQIWPEIGNV